MTMKTTATISPYARAASTQLNAVARKNRADQAIGHQRFAALLGIQGGGKSGLEFRAMAPGARQKLGDGFTDLADAARTGTPAPTTPAAVGPKTLDLPGSPIAAGIIVNGMVSAGPMSPGLASMLGPLPQAAGTHLIETASDAAQFNYDPIAMIRDRLAKLGVNPASVQLDRWVDNINGPGGQRVNQYVRGTFANGVTENYAVERVLQNPDVTAVEIQSLLARPVKAT